MSVERTPYTKEHLQDRREALQRGRRTPVNLGRAAVSGIVVAAGLWGFSHVAAEIQGQPDPSEKQDEIRARFVATPPSERGDLLIRLCNDPSFDRTFFPEGTPQCPVEPAIALTDR